MITVACVESGNYLGRGAQYVERLRSMVARNLKAKHQFVCLHPDLPGWWGKVELFRPGQFSGRVLYIDLDTVVIGPLDELAQHKGILHLADWGWKANNYGSGIMVWDAGEHECVFKHYEETVPTRFRGDQDWIMMCGEWPALPKGINVSYRYHCKDGPPAGASTISFHGSPKPHEFGPEHWVSKAWH